MSINFLNMMASFDKKRLLHFVSLVLGGRSMYAEWILLFNFLVNIALLKFIETMTHSFIPIWRLLISAFCSALLAVVFYGHIGTIVICFIVLIGIAFSFRFTAYFKYGRWLILATILVGGLLTALQPLLFSNVYFVYILLGIGIVCSSLLAFKFGWMKKLQQVVQQRFITPCSIQLNDEMWELVAYIDTGNECVEPISRAPVHFVAFDAVEQSMSESLKAGLLAWDETQPYELSMFERSLQKRIRMVAISTVQQMTTLVPAFRITLNMHEQTYMNHYVVFTKNATKFPQQAHMIAHVSVLTNS